MKKQKINSKLNKIVNQQNNLIEQRFNVTAMYDFNLIFDATKLIHRCEFIGYNDSGEINAGKSIFHMLDNEISNLKIDLNDVPNNIKMAILDGNTDKCIYLLKDKYILDKYLKPMENALARASYVLFLMIYILDEKHWHILDDVNLLNDIIYICLYNNFNNINNFNNNVKMNGLKANPFTKTTGMKNSHELYLLLNNMIELYNKDKDNLINQSPYTTFDNIYSLNNNKSFELILEMGINICYEPKVLKKMMKVLEKNPNFKDKHSELFGYINRVFTSYSSQIYLEHIWINICELTKDVIVQHKNNSNKFENEAFNYNKENKKLLKDVERISANLCSLEKENQDLKNELNRNTNEELNQEILKLKNQINDMNNEIVKYQNKYGSSINRIKTLEARLNNSSQSQYVDVDEDCLDNVELINTKKEEVSFEEKLKHLQILKFVFIGEISPHNKLREYFPNSQFIDSEGGGKQFVSDSTVDYVVYFTKRISHSVMRRINSQTKNTPHIPLNSVNQDRVVSDIYEWIYE